MLNLKRLVQDIDGVYASVKDTFLPFIDMTKKSRKMGGNFYGRSELFTSSGTHFQAVVGYIDHGNRYSCSTYYDFIFQVGGEHAKEFQSIHMDFVELFQEKLHLILDRHGFVDHKLVDGQYTYTIHLVLEPAYGTNFSSYCGLILSIEKEGDSKEHRLIKKWVKESIAEKEEVSEGDNVSHLQI